MSEILTAQTENGRAALEEVMANSKHLDLGKIPPEWVHVLVDDGVPVSYTAIDPDRKMDYPGDQVRYGYLCEAATRRDRCRQGCFRQLLEAGYDNLREAGIPWLIAHMPYWLGRRLGFEVFTNHSTFLLLPEEIEGTLGGGRPEGVEGILSIDTDPQMPDDLFVVADVGVETEDECVIALREAAWAARSNGKTRILFEHPPAPCRGSRYPIHEVRQTPLMMMAMACHARVRVLGSERTEKDLESMGEDDLAAYVDMVKVFDLPVLLEQVLGAIGEPEGGYPTGSVSFDTEAGQATLTTGPDGYRVVRTVDPEATPIPLPLEAIAQIIIGYRSARTMAYLDQLDMDDETGNLLDALFPRFWRFSRDTRLVYGK